MTPKQRTMTALAGGQADRVPFVEGHIDDVLQVRVMGGRKDFTPDEVCARLGMDGFGWQGPVQGKIARPAGLSGPQLFKEAFAKPDRITFDFLPPWIAEMGVDSYGRSFVKRGLLTDRDSLKLFDEYLPDPDCNERYEKTQEWIEKYRGDYAVFGRIRLGTATTIESMGLEVFSLMLYDDPDLVKEVHRRFSEWTVRVLERVNKLPFDFYWVSDDVADTKNPWVDTAMYEEFLLPSQKSVVASIGKPWVYHSDGNLFPILDSILTLGMNAIHPVQPSAMDINVLKERYGRRVGIVGNIDLDYTLTRGTPEEVDAEVKDRIERVGKGGGYIISSSNSLTDYCKTENVMAMAEAVRKYGAYR
jgi:uroporphyrinogen decarboxylase